MVFRGKVKRVYPYSFQFLLGVFFLALVFVVDRYVWLPPVFDFIREVPNVWVAIMVFTPIVLGVGLFVALVYSDRKLRKDLCNEIPSLPLEDAMKLLMSEKSSKSQDEREVFFAICQMARLEHIWVWGRRKPLELTFAEASS